MLSIALIIALLIAGAIIGLAAIWLVIVLTMDHDA